MAEDRVRLGVPTGEVVFRAGDVAGYEARGLWIGRSTHFHGGGDAQRCRASPEGGQL